MGIHVVWDVGVCRNYQSPSGVSIQGTIILWYIKRTLFYGNAQKVKAKI